MLPEMLFAIVLAAVSAAPQPAVAMPRATLLRRSYKTRESMEGGESSSQGSDELIERLVERRGSAELLEYDVSPRASSSSRDTVWQLPVRVIRAPDGSIELVDPAALEARIDPWLAKAQLSRQACGQTIFTWAAFTIRCDLKSAKEIIAGFDLRRDEPREGASYKAEGALSGSVLVKTQQGGVTTLTAASAIDPEYFRSEAIGTDVQVAQISGDSLSPEQARKKHADDRYVGSITTVFTLDYSGAIVRRVSTLRLEVTANGQVGYREAVNELERLPAP